MYLTQMRFYDELRKPDDLNIPSTKPYKNELEMAKELIARMSGKFEHKKYKDNYQKKLREIINAKKENKEIKEPEPAPESTAVDSLMDQLKKSLATES